MSSTNGMSIESSAIEHEDRVQLTFRNLRERCRVSRMDSSTGEGMHLRCGVVLGKVSPEAQRAEPRAQPSSVLWALIDICDPYPVCCKEGPERGERAARLHDRADGDSRHASACCLICARDSLEIRIGRI